MAQGTENSEDVKMPTIEVSHNDLCRLIGRRIPLEQLKEDLLYAKGEIDAVEGDILKIDVKDTNRPDLWSAEGIAREIKSRYKKSFPSYKAERSSVVVNVDGKVAKVRPYTTCAVIRNLKINKNVLSQMIQLQEKISGTFGRKRKEVAIGAYDLHKIKPPISYTTVKPDGIKFVPLEFKEKMTPKEIIENHPKGKEFGHLLEGYSEYPIFIDSEGKVLSLPPIINSEHTGKVTESTKDIFVECSGYNLKYLIPAINVLVAALGDRGGKIESVMVDYGTKKIVTPSLEPKKYSMKPDFVNKVSGLGLSVKGIVNLLEQANYIVKAHGDNLDLLYPAYRQDIMHPRDVVEDAIISYGYNKIEPTVPKFPTTGKADELGRFSDDIAEIMIGLGLQEIMSYTLTNKSNLLEKMNLREEEIAEIENPVSTNWSVFRNSLLPGLLEFFFVNKHADYPQDIFEIGDIISLDEKSETKTRNVRKLAVALTNSVVNYEHISSYLDAFFSSLGIRYSLKKSTHSSFIQGRCADIFIGKENIGVIGEINPVVLNNWRLEKPVAVFEINLEKIMH